MCKAIEEGLNERKMDKDAREAADEEEVNEKALATELLDEDEDEDSTSKDGVKIKRVKAVTEDESSDKKRPRKVISAKKPAQKK